MSKNITEYTLENLLPHKPPMILLSRVVSASIDEGVLIAEVDINENSMFYDENLLGVPPFVAIEYMAQTLACLAGYNDLEKGEQAKMGFVLGTRKLTNNIDKFEKNKTYQVVAKQSYFDQQLAAFECSISCEGKENLVVASLNAFRVNSLKDFLKEYNQG